MRSLFRIRLPEVIKRILLVDFRLDGSRQWAIQQIQQSFPEAKVLLLEANPDAHLLDQLCQLRQAIPHDFDLILLPFNTDLLSLPHFWKSLFLYIFSGLKNPCLITPRGKLLPPWRGVLHVLAYLYPIFAFLTILHRPIYIYRQVIKNFILSHEKPEDKFIGFGGGKGSGGLIYWYISVIKSKKFGFFGNATDSYWGFPLSIHTWPIAGFTLRALGFRKLVYFSAILLAVGLSWICIISGYYWMTVLIPLILFSTYYIINIYVSTLEILAWGFGLVAFAATYANQPVIAGIFFALILLSHPGVAFLSLMPMTMLVLSTQSLLNLFIIGGISFITTIWWLIPYWRSRHNLNRSKMINLWKQVFHWNNETSYQFLIYSAFTIAAALSNKAPTAILLAHLFPIFILYINTKVKWIFSKYTVYNFMLFTGTVYLCMHPDPFSILLFLMAIYTNSDLLWRSGSFWGFDLSPITIGKTEKRIKERFNELQDQRVGMEMKPNRNFIGWGIIAPLTYLLADTKIDFMTSAYLEIGNFNLFEKYIVHMNNNSTPEDFKNACQESGTHYMIAITDEFRHTLRQQDYKELFTLNDLNIRAIPGASPISITVFELPWKTTYIVPDTNIQISPNMIQFDAQKDQQYLLRFTAFKGWHAFQNEKRIPIIDAKPGMLIYSKNDCEITLKYSLIHYWLK